jgi:hypothetical protein
LMTYLAVVAYTAMPSVAEMQAAAEEVLCD